MSDGVVSKIKLPNGVTYNIKDDVSGYITGMTILSYGSSTWQNFIDAYNANKVVYCRASSSSNPATGSQTRLAFMAYVNNATTPTEVEFQYYRSVSSHSASQQGDQVYVYKLNKNNGWSVTVREAMSKIAVGGDLTSSYANGTITISGDIPTVPTNVSAFTNDAGYITGYTETDPVFSASAASGITNSDITSWSRKLDNQYMGYVYNSVLYIPKNWVYEYDEEDRTYSVPFYVSDTSSGITSSTPIREIGSTTNLFTAGNLILDGTATARVNLTKTHVYMFIKYGNTSYIYTVANIGDLPTVPTNISAFTNDAGYITGYTETDPIFTASAAHGISSNDITNWNGKQDTLISGTNIKTVNGNSILGSGDIPVSTVAAQIIRW